MFSFLDKDQAEDLAGVLAEMDQEAPLPGEVREPAAPLWWHGEEEATTGMMALMNSVRGGSAE